MGCMLLKARVYGFRQRHTLPHPEGALAYHEEALAHHEEAFAHPEEALAHPEPPCADAVVDCPHPQPPFAHPAPPCLAEVVDPSSPHLRSAVPTALCPRALVHWRHPRRASCSVAYRPGTPRDEATQDAGKRREARRARAPPHGAVRERGRA